MGGAISKGAKVASKCTKCCPKKLKCCSKASKGTKRVKGMIRGSRSNKSRSVQRMQAADDEFSEDEDDDCFSNWWDSFFCKCCASCKRAFVSEPPPEGDRRMDTEFSAPSHAPNLTLIGNVRIHPADILRKNNNREVSSAQLIIPEPMQMVVKL